MARRVSPVLLRRQLGAELRRHREAAGRKASDVAHALGVNASMISRLENGLRRPIIIYVQALCAEYGLDKAVTDGLMSLARAAHQEGWWERWNVGDQPSEYVGFEAGARAILNYEISCVPGLLQTPEYARSVIAAAYPTLHPEQVEQAAEFRMQRRQILRSEDPVRFHALFDEGVLHRRIGGPEVMRRQLAALIEHALLPNVTIQVLLFGANSGLGLAGGFSVLEFADDLPSDMAYAETILGALNERKEGAVSQCKELFSELSASALGEAETVNLIKNFVD